jgi:hypothetical protein
MASARKWVKRDSRTTDEGTLVLKIEGGIPVQDTLSLIRWGLVGLGWVTTDFIAPAMVQSPGSRLAACVGSSPRGRRSLNASAWSASTATSRR